MILLNYFIFFSIGFAVGCLVMHKEDEEDIKKKPLLHPDDPFPRMCGVCGGELDDNLYCKKCGNLYG